MPDNSWFADEAAAGRLLYINTEKADKWAQQSGKPILPPGGTIPAGVKTQQDLLNLWTQHDAEGLYKSDPQTGEHVSRINTFSLGKAIVDLLSLSKGNVNFATHVHDIGHAMFSIVDGLADEGSTQMQEDRDYIIGRAGVSVDDYFAEKSIVRGGAREKVHEWFADAFEVYLAQGGKAPNPRLQDIFDRTKKKLLEIYDDISNQLGIELNDQDRELFDRLLAIPDSGSQSVADFAVNEARIKHQQEIYQQHIRQEQTELEAARRVLDPNFARVRTIRGTEADVRYKVVDADNLIASTTELGGQNPAYPQELQPRQRDRMASLEQITRIANNIDPELLADSRLASEGAPIVGADNIIESGNGRVLALLQKRHC